MKIILFLILYSPFSVLAEASFQKKELNMNIKNFFKSPETFYFSNINSLPTQRDSVQEGKYHEHMRKNIVSRSVRKNPKSAPAVNDDAQDLFPLHNLVRNITELKESASISTAPWSDDYWPINKGVLGARYTDEEFIDIYDWKEAKNYVLDYKVHSQMEPEFLEGLSPAEKFDLIIAPETHLPLNYVMWSQGRSYYERYGEVENWMGICHGWAPASFMVKRPKNAITVKSYNGEFDIKFFPSDIKALSSLLWASTEYETLFVGGRCTSKEPETDRNDRAVDRDCLDNNPATLHLALTNGIGIHQKSFVMDATPEYEVWNQPVISYEYSYFNVLDEKAVTGLDQAVTSIQDFKNDPFKKYRDRRTVYIVGVHMEVVYGVETTPSHRPIDDPTFDQTSSIYYYYDLELDKDKNIIGGEWYNEQHPDFLWRPSDNTDALTYFDYYLLSEKLWDGKSPLPIRIKELAISAASKGQPLAYLVKSLVKLSQSEGK
jgi:hypothetical protein